MEMALTDLLATAGVFVASAVLGALKGHTSALDGKLGRIVKPFQPALVALAGFGLPAVTAALGIAPVDPSVFVTAPTATIAAVTLREAAARLRRRQ